MKTMADLIEFNTETFHDTYILRVLEDTAVDVLTMDVDFPVDWFESKYEKRQIVFRDAFNYQVHEQDFSGSPQILKISIVEKSQHGTQYRMETNAGYREIWCRSVELIDAA